MTGAALGKYLDLLEHEQTHFVVQIHHLLQGYLLQELTSMTRTDPFLNLLQGRARASFVDVTNF